MNEEALKYAFDLFVKDGYGNTMDDFRNLINSNPEALNHAFNLFTKDGYENNIDDFKILLGVSKQPAPITPKKKEESMVSESEVSSSVLPSDNQPELKDIPFSLDYQQKQQRQVPFKPSTPVTQPEQKRDVSKLKEYDTTQQYDRYGVPVTQFPSVPREGYLAAPSQKIEKKAEFEQKKEEFEKQVPGFLKPSVETIDKNFLSRKPSFVVDDLNRQYKDAGFEFTGSDFYETVQVKAPNGEILKMNTNVYTSDVVAEAERLKFFIKENSASIGADKIAKLQKDYEQGKQSFLTQKQIDDEAKRLNDEAMAFVDEKNQFLAETDALQALKNRVESYPEAQRNTAEYNNLVNDYNAKVIEYQKKAKDLDAKMQGIADKESNLKKTAGEYTKFKAQQGGFTGYLWRQTTDAMGSIVSGWYEFAVDRKFDILPLNLLLGKENYEFNRKRKMEDLGLDPDKVNLTPSYFDKLSDAEKRYAVLESSRLNKQIDESIRDDYKKIQKYGKLDYKGLGEIKFEGGITSDDIREYFTKTIGTLNTTKEYQERINEEGTLIQRGLGGFAGSIPAMMGGSFMRIANMYMLSTDAIAKEMQDDPDFKDVSESEKELIKGSIGVVSALLEEIGFRNAIKGKAIIGNITKRVLGRVGTNVTSNALRSSALDVIKEMSLRGGLRVLGGGLAEAETGALQQMNEFGVKDIYNAVKGKKMFDTPQTVGEYVGKVLDASGTESIGGFVTSIPSAVSSAFEKDGFQGLNDDTFKMFEELSKANDSKKFFVIDLKNKINEGKITKAEADNILANYDKSAGLVQQIPDEITDVNERKKAMDLLKERKALEDKIQGKDPALSKPIQNQINNINEQLNKITENAIQKQAQPTQEQAGIPAEISNLKDDELVKFTVTSLEDVPEEFRDKAKKVGGGEIETRDLIFGLPFGKKQTVTTPEAYVYFLTGKEVKDYAIQKQAASQVSVQPEARVGEEVVQGKPETGLEVTPEQIVTEEKPEEEVVVPEVEAKEEEVVEEVPVEEKTPEQEADLLEELLTGKKKEPTMTPQVETMTPQVETMTPGEEVMTPEAKAEEEMIVSETKPKEPEVYVPKDESIGSKEYRAKAPKHVTGRTRERTIADGTKIKGRYKLVSADEVLASHNEETFGKTEGFPVNEQGKTVNDRDYETDKAAQSEVVRIAGKLDERALSQTPIVTKDGIVVDGNNRTMSRKLAAKQGTDAAYIEALRQDADMYGIDPNEIDNVKNPMLVFEAEQEIPYTTKEFSRFNKAEKKEKSPIEKAVELSKTITDRFRRMLGSIYDKAKNPSDVTSSASTMSEIRDLLLAEGILQPNELPRYINPENGTATKEGVAFLETLLIGSALSENTIRTLDNDGMGNAKRRIIEAVVQITKNAGLGVNSLQKNIENGIKLLGKAIATNQSVTDVIRQMDLFEISEFSAEDLAIAVLLDGDGFKKFLQKYNSEVGTEGFFGSITKEGLIDELLNNKIKGYEQIRKNLRSDVETGQAKVQTGDGGIKPESKGKQGATTKEEGVVSEKPKTMPAKKLADAVRKNLKIKGPDGLQSNIFGVPIAIWNAAMDTVAAAIDAGVAISEAIQKGADYISENYKKRWQKAQYENRVLDAIYTNAINLARENGLSDDGIKRYLERKGLTTEQIDKLIKKRVPKEKKPPTAEEIVGKPKPKKVTVNEMAALKDQIRLEARAAREAKGDLNSKRKALAEAINKLVAKGTITVRQANAIIKRVNFVNLDNPVMVERLINYAGNIFNDADYDTRMQEIRALQSQVKKKNHTSMEGTVKDFIFINPELIPDNRILEYIQALDDMNTRTPSYVKMNDMFDEVMSYKTEPEGFNAIKTFQKLMDKLESIALNEVKSVEDYINLIRDINAFKRKASQLLSNGDITQAQYDQAIENVGKDQAAVEKKYEKELTTLKEGLLNEIESQRPKTNPNFTPEENALIEKYLEVDKNNLMKLAPEELYILNDLLQNIEDGQMDYYRFSDIVSKAYSKDAIDKTTEQLDKTKFDMALDKGKQLLSEFESSFWEGLLGMGRVTSGALQKFIVSPMMRAISSYEKFLQDSYNTFSKIKNKYGINQKDMNKLGMLTTYLQEYMAQFDPSYKGTKDIGKRDWFKEILNDKEMQKQYPSEKLTVGRLLGKVVGRGKTQLESMKEIWNSLPKDKDGNVDPKAVYDSYMANDGKYFSKKEKAFFDEIMDWKQKNTTTKQKAANELKGNPFKEMPFHLLRSRYGEGAKQIAPKASGANGMVRIEAGTGKERKDQTVGPININFEQLFINGVEQTARDYYLSTAIQDVNNVMSGVASNLGKGKKTLVETITGALSEALNYEFDKTESFAIFKRLLAARASMVLFDPERTARELIAGLLSYPIRAKTLSGYKDLFRGVKRMKELLDFTESPIRLRENISSALDISDGQIKKMNPLQKATLYLAGFPERTMMVTSWMPTFRSEFKNLTGNDFDMEAFRTDKAYKEKYGKAIREAAAVADAQTEKIIGTTTKAGQRREIRIAPEFLANLVGKRGTVAKNTVFGQVFGFFTNYPYREVTEFFNGFKEAAEVIRNNGISSTPQAAAQLSKPLGIALNVALYGYLASVSYAYWLMLLGDDDDEERGKQQLEELSTTKGIVEDFQGNAISLLASRYGVGSKALFQVGGTIAYGMSEDEERKKWIKKFMKGSMYVDPLPVEKATEYKGKEAVLASISSYVPQLVVAADRIIDIIEGAGDVSKLYEKLKEKGIDALTEDEKGQVLAISALFKTSQLGLNLFGNSLPMYNKMKIYMKKLRTESGVTEKTASSEKREAYGGYKTIEELQMANPEKYKELSKKGGALYEYRIEQKKQREQSKEKKAEEFEQKYGVKPKKSTKKITREGETGRGGTREGERRKESR